MEVFTDSNKDILSGISLIPQILHQYNIPIKCDIIELDTHKLNSFKEFISSLRISDMVPFRIDLTYLGKEYNREAQLNLWVMMFFASFSIERHTNRNILTLKHMRYFSSIIHELYLRKLMETEDVFILMKILLIIALTTFKPLTTREIIITSVKALQFSLILMNKIFNCKLTDHEQVAMIDFIDYFDQVILSSDYNCYLIYSLEEVMFILNIIASQDQVIPSNKKITNTLYTTLCKVFNLKFDIKVMNSMIMLMKNVLINFNTKSLSTLIGDLKLTNSVIELIKLMISSDFYNRKIIQNGFFLTDSQRSGMRLKVFGEKTFSLLFSFKTLHPNLYTSSQILISLQENDKDKERQKPKDKDKEHTLLTIVIENGVLILIINKEKKTCKITIKHNESYRISLVYNKQRFILYCNEILIHISAEFKWKDESDCYIGYEESMDGGTCNHFVGELGSIIFFKDIFNEDISKTIKGLELNYDKILFSNYNQASLERYNYFNPRYFPLNISNQLANPFMEQIKWLITPKAFYLHTQDSNKNKTSYNYNVFHLKLEDKKEAPSRVTLLAPFSSDFYIFNYKTTIVEFLKLDGMMFLCLHLEYYSQLVQILSKHTQEADQMALASIIYDNLENILKLINTIYTNYIHLFEQEFNQFFYQLINIVQLLCQKKKITQGILCEFFTFLSGIKAYQQEIVQYNYNIVFYSEIRGKCLLFLMDIDLYDLDEENAILTDLFTIVKKIIEDKIEFGSVLNIVMMDKLLLFTDLLSEKPIKIKEKNSGQYKQLIMSFITKALYKERHDIVNALGNFIKVKVDDKEVVYNLIKIIYYSNWSLGPFVAFHQILFEILNVRLSQGDKDNSDIIINSIMMDQSTKITNNKLIALVALCLFSIEGIWNIRPEYSRLHYHFSKSNITMLKAIVASLLTTEDKQEKVNYILNIDSNTDKKLTWTHNHEQIVTYMDICTKLVVSDDFIQNDIKNSFMFLINCLISLLQYIQTNSPSEQITFLFGNKCNICPTLFHQVLKYDLINDALSFFVLLMESHDDCFVFKFIVLEFNNDNAQPMLIELIESIGKQIDCKVQLQNSSNSCNNLINYMLMLYRLVKIPNIPFIKIYPSIVKLFSLLKINIFIYARFELIVDKIKNIRKFVFELLFEMIMDIQIGITCQEHTAPEYHQLFDYFYIKMKDNKINTLPYYIDFYSLNKVKRHEPENLAKFQLINASIIFESTSNTILLLLKSFLYKKQYFSLDSIDDLFKTKLNKFIIDLIENLGRLKQKKIINKESKSINKKLSYLRSLLDLYAFDKLKIGEIELEFFKFLNSNDTIERKNLMDFESITTEAPSEPNHFIKKSNKNMPTITNIDNGLDSDDLEHNKIKDQIDFMFIQNKAFILNPKKYFLLTIFAKSFHDIFFSNDSFIQMKSIYINQFDVSKETKTIDFPSKLKNFTNGYYPPLFLKQDKNFFEDEFFSITHQYFEPTLKKIKAQGGHKEISFKKRRYKLTSSTIYECELVNIDYAWFGMLLIDVNCLIFNSGNKSNDPRLNPSKMTEYMFSSMYTDVFYGDKQIFIFFSEISEVFVRRFLLMNQAIEIYLKNGKSYFFNLFKKQFLTKFITCLQSNCPDVKMVVDYTKEFNSINYTKLWQKDEISTFDYLLYLNKYSTRSFKDSNQYPVFPWLLYSYNDLNRPRHGNYRNLKYPISIQSDEKITDIQEKYMESCSSSKFGSHFGCHYSTGPFVYFYMMRLYPFTQSMIKLQNMELEASNRMFISFDETLKILCKIDDNRELIPQFFSMIEMFINVNCINLKKRKKSNIQCQVDDLELTMIDKSRLEAYADFIINHLKLLNSKKIKIIQWIDFIFGVNQLNNKDDLCNIFPKFCYEKLFDLEKIHERKKRKYSNIDKQIQNIKDKIHMVINFGQTPAQILKDPLKLNESRKDEFENVGFEVHSKRMCLYDKGIIFFAFDTKKEKVLLLRKNNIDIIELGPMSKKKTFSIKRFKSLKKLRINNHKPICIYSPRYSIIALKQFTWFITCGYLDHSFKIVSEAFFLKEVLCEDFVCSLAKINETDFFTGLYNGKLIEWELYQKNDCRQKRHIIVHDSPICAICVNQVHKIVITSAHESTIYIRKLYDFELLSVIKSDQGLICVDMKISVCNFLYILYNKENTGSFVLKGYTLNGINFASSPEGCYNNFVFTKTANVAIGYQNDTKIIILSGSSLERLEEKSIQVGLNGKTTWFDYNSTKDLLYISFWSGSLQQFPLKPRDECMALTRNTTLSCI